MGKVWGHAVGRDIFVRVLLGVTLLAGGTPAWTPTRRPMTPTPTRAPVTATATTAAPAASTSTSFAFCRALPGPRASRLGWARRPAS
jgi:hypothetical protein